MDQPAILLIDDDPSFTYLIQRYAHTSGCRLISTSAANSALGLAQREHPALIVVDLLVAPVDGWRVVQQLKADQQTQAIPLAVCSTLLDHERAWDEGADYCLPKPVMYDDFLAMLAKTGVSVVE